MRSRQRRCMPRSHLCGRWQRRRFLFAYDKRGIEMSLQRTNRLLRRRAKTIAAPQRPTQQRRRVLSASVAGALMALIDPALRAGAWAAGSDAPEKTEVKVGFIPLTDCASVVIASVMEFDKKYGIKIVPSKEASWAGVRDKLVNGELDASHVLYGLIYGVQMGIGGPTRDMAVLMNLNR